MANTKRVLFGKILAIALLGSATLAFAATDYSAMSNEELAAKRGAMQGAAVQERQAFQNEWQKRLQQMSPEEHQKYMRGDGMGSGNGPMREEKQERMQQRQEQGGGMGPGGGMGGGMGPGGGMGGGRR